MKSILLLTSGQPSTNPRLVKEADALSAAGYKVTVIYQYRSDWAAKLDGKILENRTWASICIGGSPNSSRFTYLKSKLLHKLAKLLVKWFGLKSKISELALGRCVLLLVRKAKHIPADFYLAHNLGALPAAVLAAKENNSKCGFDAEDFHRNETSDDKLNPGVLLNTYIEDKYIKQLDYFTTASPLISVAYQELYSFLNPTTLLNVFPKQAINLQKATKNSKLTLFWFSQTIGCKRGLEEVIEAMATLKIYPIELHLLGEIDDTTKKHFSAISDKNGLNSDCIFYYPPIPADEIFSFASQFDIGLATEISTPKNRNICLTNKIFTYIQSGLAVLASATSAQQMLMDAYPGMGLVYTSNQLSDRLYEYIQTTSLLESHQQAAGKYALDTLNWETEKEKLLLLVQSTLN